MGIFDRLLGALFTPTPEPVNELLPGRRTLVRGVVVPRDLLASPLTGTNCVYYQYTVEEWRPTAIGTGGYWQMSQRDEAICEFYLRGQTGRILVAPFRARVERKGRRKPSFFSMGPDDQRAQELLLCPGDIIDVHGIAESIDDVHDEDRGFRESANRMMVRAPAGEHILIELIKPGPRRA